MATNTRGSEDKALRPKTLREFAGQEHAKPNLEIFIRSAKSRGSAMDHVLLSGPPGLGKTTLSEIIANELGTRLITVFAPSVKTTGELCAILASLKKNDVLFIDEIHALDNTVEEILYPAMEDGLLKFVSNNFPIKIRLEPFTLIGATTRAGMLQRPLRDRFGIKVEMQPYSDEELSSIIKGSAKKLGMSTEDDGALELARRARGVPRTANMLLHRIRDFAHHYGTTRVDASIVAESCNRLGIDDAGLDINMRRYLEILAQKKVPVAVKTLVSILGESADTVEDVIEPHLMTLGFIEKTPKGRVITASGGSHIAASRASARSGRTSSGQSRDAA